MTEKRFFKIVIPFLYFGMVYLYASALVLWILNTHNFLSICFALMGAVIMVALHYINEYRRDYFK
tara:strand:+ start:1624 stop:1818 length:195 start_codon:yes stop_codon:yes gene_type:complete